MRIQFTQSATRQWKRLPKNARLRLQKKLQWFLVQNSPLEYAKHMRGSQYGSYRFRIGDYRIIFDVRQDVIIILKVGHRRDVYK